jgi:hypothetical protein
MLFGRFASFSGFFRSLFSRAEIAPGESRALAPDGRFQIDQEHPSVAKAVKI